MTTGLAARRAQFVTDGLAAAPPQTLLVLLLDRAVLDLGRGEAAQREERWEEANRQLQHAQAIVAELAQALDTTEWPEGQGLAALYGWLQKELVVANISRDAARTGAARELLEPIADAFRQAVTGVPSVEVSDAGAQKPVVTFTPAAQPARPAEPVQPALRSQPFRPPVAAFLGGVDGRA